MDILNKDTINQQKAKNPFIGKTPEEIDRAIAMLEPLVAKERNTSMKNRLGNFMGDASNIFLQSGGIKPPEGGHGDLNNIIMKEMIRQKFNPKTPTSYAGTTIPEGYEVGVDKLGNRVLQKKEKPTGFTGDTIPEGYDLGYDRNGNKILTKHTTPKVNPTEQFRQDLIGARDSIKRGDTSVNDEISMLEDKYPDKDFTMQRATWRSLAPKTATPTQASSIFGNIMSGVKGFFNKPTPTQTGNGNPDRDAAVKELQTSGYPTTEANIQEVIRQLKGK